MHPLERCLELEEQLESSRNRVGDLEVRLGALLNEDPESVTRAEAWVRRAENAEALLTELLPMILEPSLKARVRAQLRSLDIMRRDQGAMHEKPPPGAIFEQGTIDAAAQVTCEHTWEMGNDDCLLCGEPWNEVRAARHTRLAAGQPRFIERVERQVPRRM